VDYIKAKKCGLAPVHGSDVGMGSVPSGLGAPASEVVGFSSASFPVLKEHSSPYPPVFSTTEVLMEKSSTRSSFEASNVSSTANTSVSKGFGVLSGAATLGVRQAVSALVRSALGGDPPLPPSSEMAPSSALVGFDPALGDCSSGANTLGERLHYLLHVMSEPGTPIYPSESKSVLKYSRKNKVGKLDKHLLAEALETFNVPRIFPGRYVGLSPSPCQLLQSLCLLKTRAVNLSFSVDSFSQAVWLFLRQKWVWFHSLRSSLSWVFAFNVFLRGG
jgi:hypothetical protein